MLRKHRKLSLLAIEISQVGMKQRKGELLRNEICLKEKV